MIQGPAGVRICDECVRLCMEIVEDGYEAEQHEFDTPDEIPTPHEIRAVLDQYVIGQDEAKVALSVARTPWPPPPSSSCRARSLT